MTRLLTTGYETGDVAEAGALVQGTGVVVSVVNTAPTPRAGAYCLKTTVNATTWTITTKGFNFGLKTEVWVRFAFLAHQLSSVEYMFAQMADSAGGAQCCLTFNPTDGLIRLYRGTGTTTLLATASASVAQDTWMVIDWRTQTLTTTTGASEVWVNGNRLINFSGDNTNTANVNVQTLLLGFLSGATNAGANGSHWAYDDIAVNDTAGTLNNGRAGDGRVILLLPNGAGSSTQFARGGTDTGANYSQVSEVPPSMAQYNASAVVGNRDLYAHQDLAVAVQAINSVEVVALAMNSDA